MRKLITIFKLSIHTVMALIKIFDFIRGSLLVGRLKGPYSNHYSMCYVTSLTRSYIKFSNFVHSLSNLRKKSCKSYSYIYLILQFGIFK